MHGGRQDMQNTPRLFLRSRSEARDTYQLRVFLRAEKVVPFGLYIRARALVVPYQSALEKIYSSQNFRHQPFFSGGVSSSNTGSSLKPRNPPARVVAR